MKIRKLSFGYCIQNGRVCVDERSADTVRMIFDRYVQLASYEKLANMLERQGIPYITGKRWNKNIIARILKDNHYIGDNEYPAILSQEVFRRAEAANCWTCESPKQIRIIKKLRSLVCCPSCGGSMLRNFRANWRCPDCMKVSVKLTDEGLIIGVTELLAQLREQAHEIEIPGVVSENNSVHDLEEALAQELNSSELDEVSAKSKAMQLAAVQFDTLGSEDYETMRLKYMLSSREQDGEVDTGLLFDITSAILLHPSGAVSLKLKNGQTTERSQVI